MVDDFRIMVDAKIEERARARARARSSKFLQISILSCC